MTHKIIRGFTLIECLIVLIITLLILTLSTYGWRAHLQSVRTQYVMAMLSESFSVARNTAIAYHAPVFWCGSIDGVTCTEDWTHGWIIRFEENGLPTLWKFPSLQSGEHITITGAGKTHLLRLSPEGTLFGENSTVHYCTTPCSKQTVLILSATGRARVQG